MLLLLGTAAVAAVTNPALCGETTFCAKYGTEGWECQAGPTYCYDEEDIMLHMRVDHSVNSTATACTRDSTPCANGTVCVAGQCHTPPNTLPEAFQVAAATCASLGPEFVVSVSNETDGIDVRCTGGNTALLDEETVQAYSCAMCAGYAARMWGSTVNPTEDFGCTVRRTGATVTSTATTTASTTPTSVNSCGALYNDNIFIARERTYELESVPSTGYLLVGILPTDMHRQMMPHTITVPLRSRKGANYYTQKDLPRQLHDWTADLQLTVKSPMHDIHGELAFLWRFVTAVTTPADYGSTYPVFGIGRVQTVGEDTLAPGIPQRLCTIVPAYVQNQKVVRPDPYCGGGDDEGSATPTRHTYGLNHYYVRRPHICGILSKVANPLFAHGERTIAPYADFLVVPQRWTGDTRGRATDESVRDIDRRSWNNGNPCNTVARDWCLRRDFGVTNTAGKCVWPGRVLELKEICHEDNDYNEDCRQTVDRSYTQTTTTVPALPEQRRRCNSTECTVNATGCRNAYAPARYSYHANATWQLALPSFLANTLICRHLCDISMECVAFQQLPLTCTHWYDTLEGGETQVTTKTPLENGCYTVQYDANVITALRSLASIYNVGLSTCYQLCNAFNCTELVYSAPINRCGLLLDGPSLGLHVQNGGDGLHAVRDPNCVCPETSSTTSAHIPPTTATITGFIEPRAIYGTLTGATNNRYACGPVPQWICPVYARCNDNSESCAPWRLRTVLSNETYYYDPARAPHCTGVTSNSTTPAVCQGVSSRIDTATSTQSTAAVGLGFAASAASIGPTADNADTPVVEIVIASVVGVSGLALIGAGFYWRKRMQTDS